MPADTDTTAAIGAAGNAETQPPWSMRAPGRRVAVLAAAIIAVAVILAIVALLVING